MMKKLHDHREFQQEYNGPSPETFSEFQGGSKSGPALKDSEIAEYLSDMLIPMRQLAGEADFKFLTYLLDMAIEEANAKMSNNQGAIQK